MSAFGPKLQRLSRGRVAFWCPGCNSSHQVTVKEDAPQAAVSWEFNGNCDRPTFSPSILLRSGHYARAHKPGDDCWCNFEERMGRPPSFKCAVCHSFVIDGKIQFLGDSTHALAGQTVDLPDWPAEQAD